MAPKINIALSIPNADRPDRYFSFGLHQSLRVEPSVFEQPPRLFVVSDIEGNFQMFCRLLIKNKIIDKYFNWQFRNGHLVVLGDCFDRGLQVAECLWLIYSLEEKAKKNGGYVHFILGNHEIMNMNGDWRYVHPAYAQFGNTSQSLTALYDGSNEIWRWLLTKNIIVKIGNLLFVHGGISVDLAATEYSIEEINFFARQYYTRANEFFTNKLLNILFNSDQSPFWYRGYYQGSTNQSDIDAILSRYNVNTIITGHTVVEHIQTYYNGRVINTDTDHAAGNSEALFIYKGKFYRVGIKGNKVKIK